MRVYSRYFLALVVSTFFCSNAVMAVETVIETDTPSKVKRVSIDALVAKYHAASEKNAYKIMNQIKLEIARMSQERQSSAIGKVRQSVAQKERVPQQEKHPTKKISDKKKKVSKKQKKQIKKQKKRIEKQRKQRQKRVKKHKNRVRKVRKHIRYTEKHPDPMSVMNGTSGSSGMRGKANGSIGGHSGSTGGHSGGTGGHSGGFGGGMGSMGSGMGGF